MTAVLDVCHAPNIIDHLRSFSPFAHLSDSVLVRMMEFTLERHYETDETIFSAGQFDGEDIYLPVEGALTVLLNDVETGAVYQQAILPGEGFGLEYALGDSDDRLCRLLTMASAEPSSVLVVDSQEFRELVSDHSEIANLLLIDFANRLMKTGMQARQIATTPERAVFEWVLSTVSQDTCSGHWQISKLPRHREIADLTGADETIVARAIATLIQSKIAERSYPGLTILDMERLNHLSR